MARKVLILPFHIDQQTPDRAYLSEGILEELIDIVTELGELIPLGRNLSLFLDNHPKPGAELKKEFGVEYIIEGSLKKREQSYLFSLRLIDANDESPIKSLKTPVELSNWTHALQESTSQMLSAVSSSRQAPLERNLEGNARELYLKGIYHWNRYTHEEMKRAISFFQKSIKHDASFAPAYAGLANAYIVIAVMGYDLPGPAFDAALKNVNLALGLNNKHSESYLCAAFLNIFYQREYARAKVNLDVAYRLNQNNPRILQLYSFYYAYQQDFNLSEKHCTDALKLDPLSIPIYAMLVRLAIFKKEYGKGLEIIEATRAIEDPCPPIMDLKGIIHILSGNVDLAISTLEKSLKLSPDNLLTYAYLIYALTTSGFSEEAFELKQQLEETVTTKRTGNYDYAMAIVKLAEQDLDGFFLHVNAALELGHTGIIGDVYNNPLYSSIRKDIRYLGFLKKNKLGATPPVKTRQPSRSITLNAATKESLTLDPQDIAFIKGDGNYSTVHWFESSLLKQKILRITLKQLEVQLADISQIQRVHKSYMVNLNERLSISGNARGFFIESEFYPIRIPISRSRSKEICEMIAS
ncbi:MAG: LytTR family transcriptional regulator DNA-binding domain-containing protein [Cyclobacteriaceae bacterium]